MKAIILVLLATTVSCAHPTIDPAPQSPADYRIAIDHKLVEAASRISDAYDRYTFGVDAEDSEAGRAAFRRECRAHAIEREMTLDDLKEHAQMHAYLWHEWVRVHCIGDECATDSGPKPERPYKRTLYETLALAQRDACDRAM